MKTVAFAGLVLVGALFGLDARADLLSGSGESCKTTNDCKLGLRCNQNRCTDSREGASCKTTFDCGGRDCVKGACAAAKGTTATVPLTEEQTGEGGKPPWMEFALGGVHLFAGLTWLGGPAYAGRIDGNGRFDTAANFSFLFAVRGGLLIGRHEIAVEVSPLTYAFYFGGPRSISDPQFQVNGTYGYLVPLLPGEGTEKKFALYWPLRGGVGTFFGNISSNAYFQVRADLVGLALRVGHVLVEVHAPSFRWGIYTANGLTPTVFSWETGLSLSYVF